MKKSLGLVPLMNFAIVDEDKEIYRSAQPILNYQYGWLKEMLNLKTIVNLRSEASIDSNHAERAGIKVVEFKVPDHHEPTEEQALEFMKLVKDESNFPLLFHCEHGHGRTSTFCVLLRLAQGWTLDDAMKEETEKFHYKFRHQTQLNFLKSFKYDKE